MELQELQYVYQPDDVVAAPVFDDDAPPPQRSWTTTSVATALLVLSLGAGEQEVFAQAAGPIFDDDVAPTLQTQAAAWQPPQVFERDDFTPPSVIDEDPTWSAAIWATAGPTSRVAADD